MKHFVPVMKLAAAKILYAEELKRLPDDATDEVRARSARKVIQSIENRMGQLTKDNLNWHPLLNDFLNATFLATTWNYGSLALFGGAQVDVARAMRDLKLTAQAKFSDPDTAEAIRKKIKEDREQRGETGRNSWFTRNMSQVLGTKLIYIFVTGLLTYLFTGSFKRDPKHIDKIRTGKKTSEGKDEYLDIAGYNSVYRDFGKAELALTGLRHKGTDITKGWSMGLPRPGEVGQIVRGKLSPALKLGSDFWTNTDWTGNRQVFDPDAAVGLRLKQMGEHAIKSNLPISVKQATEKWDSQGSSSLRTVVGTNIPPRRETDSDAEARFRQMMIDRQPRVIGHDTADHESMLKEAKDAFTAGNSLPLDEMVRKGQLSSKESKTAHKFPNGENPKRLDELVQKGVISRQESNNVISSFQKNDNGPLEQLQREGRITPDTKDSIAKDLASKPLIARMTGAAKIQFQDIIKVWPDMTEAEKLAVWPSANQKYTGAFKITPKSDIDKLKEDYAAIKKEVVDLKAKSAPK
jgi:polyhydroxyalkanoate synthesis regulator phasin